MTSAETSVGDFPGETVRTMAKIVESTEARGLDKIAKIDWDPHTTSGIMSKAAAEIAERAEAKFIVAFTKSGDTARRIARLRPSTPLIVFTSDETTTKTLAWVWALTPSLPRCLRMRRSCTAGLTRTCATRVSCRSVTASSCCPVPRWIFRVRPTICASFVSRKMTDRGYASIVTTSLIP